MKVQLFVPCFIDQLYPSVAMNMVKVLRKAGCEVNYNTNQTCCGQPAFNAGFWEDAKDVCSKFIKDFEGDEPIVTPSASCAGFVRNYYKHMFASDIHAAKAKSVVSRMFEFSEFLVHQMKVEDFGASLQGVATYHDSCAALREVRIKGEPRRLLANVKGLTLVEMNDVETCCGFGGSFAVKFTEISGAMADQKITNAAATGAQYLISTDMSCLMHLGGVAEKSGVALQTLHLADVLASGW